MARLFRKILIAIGLITAAASLSASLSVAADQCTAVKTKSDCGNKAGCAWNGKACAAKAAALAKPTAASKANKAAGKAAAAKPAAKKTEEKKADEKKPDVKPSTDTPIDEEIPAGDGDTEDF